MLHLFLSVRCFREAKDMVILGRCISGFTQIKKLCDDNRRLSLMPSEIDTSVNLVFLSHVEASVPLLATHLPLDIRRFSG